MGRPRGFDEADAVRAAAGLFAERSYDGVSVDDLVARLGIHRNSLYKTFGSKRGLYLAALRWHLENEVHPTLREFDAADGDLQTLRRTLTDGVGRPVLDLVLMAAVERAPVDTEVAAEVGLAFEAVDAAVARVLGVDRGSGGSGGPESTAEASATILGLRLRARAAGPPA